MWGNLVSLQLYPFAWLAHGAQKGGKKKNTRCPANCGSTREVLTYRYLCNMDLHGVQSHGWMPTMASPANTAKLLRGLIL